VRTTPLDRPHATETSTAGAAWPLGSLIVLAAAVCLSVTTELFPTGVLPSMSRDLRVSEGTVGLLVTAYAVMVAAFAAPLAMATSRLPRRPLLVVTLLGYTASNVLMSVSTAYPVALAGRIVGGAMHGLFWGMLGGYVARIVPADRIGRSLTITSTGGVLATLLVVPAGAALARVVGWRGAYAVLTCLGLVVALIAWRALPKVPGRAAAERLHLPTVLRSPGLVGLVTMTAVVCLGHFSFATYVAPFLLHAGVPENRIAVALLLNGLAGAIGLLAASVLIDRHLRTSMIASMVLLVVSFLMLGLLGEATVAAVAFSALTGVVLGSLPIFMQAAVIRAAPHAAEPASALNASAFNVGIAGGAIMGGLVVDRISVAALPWLAGALALSAVVAILVDRRVGVGAARTLVSS
jgi:predicted MFS family arabinose efflux permease